VNVERITEILAEHRACRSPRELAAIQQIVQEAGRDLSLVPTEDLIESLVARSDVSVIALLASGEHDPKHDTVRRRFEGDYLKAMGLAFDMAGRIAKAMHEDSSKAEGGEDG